MGKATTVTAIGVLMAFLFLAPLIANATSYTVTITTDKPTYGSGVTVTVSGTVTPAPPAGTAVGIAVTNPSGAQVVFISPVVGATGSYSGTFVTGGTANWVSGTFTVTGTWSANATGPAYVKSATFTYNAGVSTTTSASGGKNVTTTIVQQTTTTVVVSTAVTTTVVQGGGGTTTTVVQQGATTTIVQQGGQTTVTLTGSGGGGTSADLPIAVVGVVIAVIAGALSVVALRKH